MVRTKIETRWKLDFAAGMNIPAASELLLDEAKTFATTFRYNLWRWDRLGASLRDYEDLVTRCHLIFGYAQLRLFENRTEETENLFEAASDVKRELRKILRPVVEAITALPEQQFLGIIQNKNLDRYVEWLHYLREVERLDPDAETRKALETKIHETDHLSLGLMISWEDEKIGEAGVTEFLSDHTPSNARDVLVARDKLLESVIPEVAHHYNEMIDLWTKVAKEKGFASVYKMVLARDRVDPDLLKHMTLEGEGAPQHRFLTFMRGEKSQIDLADLLAKPEIASEIEIPWEDAKGLLVKVLTDLYGQDAGMIVENAFAEGRVDGRYYPEGKEAISQATRVAGAGSFLLTHYAGKPYDVILLAHEMAHLVHYEMGKETAVELYDKTFDTPPMLEIFSLLAELHMAHALRATLPDEEQAAFDFEFANYRLWFHQQALTMHEFELAAYAAKDKKGVLTAEDLTALWQENLDHYWGNGLDPSLDRYGWASYSFTNYMFQTPFYLYAYPLAARIAESIYERMQDSPEMIRRTLQMIMKQGEDIDMARALEELCVTGDDIAKAPCRAVDRLCGKVVTPSPNGHKNGHATTPVTHATDGARVH